MTEGVGDQTGLDVWVRPNWETAEDWECGLRKKEWSALSLNGNKPANLPLVLEASLHRPTPRLEN